MQITTAHRISPAPVMKRTTCSDTGSLYGGGDAGGMVGGDGLGGLVGEGGGYGGSVFECPGHQIGSPCVAPTKESGM